MSAFRFAGTRKVQEVGNSRQVTIPAEIADKWNVEQGDELYVQETEEGIEVRPCD